MAVRERAHLLTVLGEEVPASLTTTTKQTAPTGVEGDEKDEIGGGEILEEEGMEEGSKCEGLEESEQRPTEGPLESHPMEARTPTAMDHSNKEDKDGTD